MSWRNWIIIYAVGKSPNGTANKPKQEEEEDKNQ